MQSSRNNLVGFFTDIVSQELRMLQHHRVCDYVGIVIDEQSSNILAVLASLRGSSDEGMP